jgi:heptaprenyl diphosphate synthase
MAFQIIDDILDFESTEGVMGKPVGKDLREGLCTLPLIHALRSDPEGMKALLGAMKEDPAMVQAVIDRTFERGGIGRAREAALRYTERARREIGRLPDLPQKAELGTLAERLLTRNY